MKFERLTGRKSKALVDLENEILVLKLRNGKTYGGRLDEYYYNGGGVIALYHCKLLDRKHYKWVDHDFKVRYRGKLILDHMPDFWLAEIREIYLLPEDYRDKFDLDDVLQMFIDPHYKPLSGIECDWNPGKDWKDHRHRADCDFRLHEALSSLTTHPEMMYSESGNEKWMKKTFDESFRYVRRRLLIYGARIP